MCALLSQSVNWGSVVRQIVAVRVKYVCATKERFVCLCVAVVVRSGVFVCCRCGGCVVLCALGATPASRLLAGAFGNTEHVRKSLKWRVLKY